MSFRLRHYKEKRDAQLLVIMNKSKIGNVFMKQSGIYFYDNLLSNSVKISEYNKLTVKHATIRKHMRIALVKYFNEMREEAEQENIEFDSQRSERKRRGKVAKFIWKLTPISWIIEFGVRVFV